MAYETLIQVDELVPLLAEGGVFLADCSFDLPAPERGLELYREAHLPGAQFLDLERDLSGKATGSNGRHPLPDPSSLAATLSRAGLRQGQQVVAYDRGDGAFAARLWWLLRWLGHDRVAVLDGGLKAWERAGQPLVSGDEPGKAGQFDPPGVRWDWLVDADAVLANIAAPADVVLDARSRERFAGRVALFDKVPGHIPGARNRPYVDNLDDNGRFKPAATLRAEFVAAAGTEDPARLILQCGSGVTACHNALALAVAGLPGARLYPGSWSEWSADPARPVARLADEQAD